MRVIGCISCCCQQFQKRKIDMLTDETNNMRLKKTIPRQFWLNLVIFVLIIISLIVYLQPWRVVQTVTVQSATIPAATIETAANVKKNTPLWRVVGQTNFIVQRLLQKKPAIDAAQVTVKGQQVTIKVIEKVTAGYVYQNGHWVVMDRNGRQRQVAAPKGDAPIYAGFKSQSELQQVVQGFVGLELTLRQNISQITLSPNKDNAHRLVIIMDDGNTVYATSKTFGQKISYYPGIAAQMPEKGIVDLQFGAYSHAYGTPQDETQKNAADKTTQTP